MHFAHPVQFSARRSHFDIFRNGEVNLGFSTKGKMKCSGKLIFHCDFRSTFLIFHNGEALFQFSAMEKSTWDFPQWRSTFPIFRNGEVNLGFSTKGKMKCSGKLIFHCDFRSHFQIFHWRSRFFIFHQRKSM